MSSHSHETKDMHAIMLIGVQATGKSTFYQQNFADTHIRVNLDMLRTRHRESRLIETCLEIGQPFVIDNTNVTIAVRAKYLSMCRDVRVDVVGYYFQSSLQACKARNDSRTESRRVPLKGLLGTHARLELPRRSEGFVNLLYVRLEEDGTFKVEEWRDEV